MANSRVHWKRGLYRVWLVISALWVLLAGWMTLPDLYRHWPDVLDVKTISKSMSEAQASITNLSVFGWIDARTQESAPSPSGETATSSISFGVDPADDSKLLDIENALDDAHKAKDTVKAKSIEDQLTNFKKIGHPQYWQIVVISRNGKQWTFAGVPYDTKPDEIHTILTRFFLPLWLDAAYPKLFLILLPPLILLLAAVLMRWIITGFRAPTT